MRLKTITNILVLALAFGHLSLSAGNYEANEKHVKVALRMIGHQLLLNSGDSSSRVLPVIENDGRYIIQFESAFSFEPSELVASVNGIVQQTDLAHSYIVEVTSCTDNSVVYSYEVGDGGREDIIPCKGRKQPESCYMILFTLADQEPIEASWYSSALARISGLGPPAYLVVTFLLLLVLISLVVLWRRQSPARVNPNLIPLGTIHFDKLNNLLIKDNEQQVLTSKEANLLLLLHSEANNTVQREVILNRVWGDEGDYVGRTLDVFISKLRKKLDLDANVKIVNIRGIGYKLVLKV